ARRDRQRALQRAAPAAGEADNRRHGLLAKAEGGRRRLRPGHRQDFDGVANERLAVVCFDSDLQFRRTKVCADSDAPRPHHARNRHLLRNIRALPSLAARGGMRTMARILVVEDENLVAMQITWMLEDAGHFVVGPERSVAAATKVL